jgi:hypothetical protein
MKGPGGCVKYLYIVFCIDVSETLYCMCTAYFRVNVKIYCITVLCLNIVCWQVIVK